MKFIFRLGTSIAALIATMLTVGSAQADLITAVTTSEGIANTTLSQTLTSITDAGGSRSVLKFATGKLGDLGNNEHWGQDASAAGSTLAALTDNRIDTGTLNTGNGGLSEDDRFTFTDTIVVSDKLFLIFNGANDNYPTEVAVYDAAGTQLGSTVTITDFPSDNLHFANLNLQRPPSGDLDSRRMYGYSVAVSAFGVGDPSLITGVGFAAGAGTDYNLVGIASAVPEPSSMALFAMVGLGMAYRRKKR